MSITGVLAKRWAWLVAEAEGVVTLLPSAAGVVVVATSSALFGPVAGAAPLPPRLRLVQSCTPSDGAGAAADAERATAAIAATLAKELLPAEPPMPVPAAGLRPLVLLLLLLPFSLAYPPTSAAEADAAPLPPLLSVLAESSCRCCSLRCACSA